LRPGISADIERVHAEQHRDDQDDQPGAATNRDAAARPPWPATTETATGPALVVNL
jgi:hypothetical protein